MPNIQLGTIALLAAAISFMLAATKTLGTVTMPAQLFYPAILAMILIGVGAGIAGIVKKQGRIAAIAALLIMLVLGGYATLFWVVGHSLQSF